MKMPLDVEAYNAKPPAGVTCSAHSSVMPKPFPNVVHEMSDDAC